MAYSIFFGLFGGLGLFLYGIKIMSTGMQRAAGDKLRQILEILTSNPYIATVTGIVVTLLVQSSSTTSVMVVGFVNAGLMNLSQAVGTMLGANIGTTITAQIISFDLDVIIYPVLGIGAFIYLFGKKRLYKNIGQIILGFGILFLGLSTMSAAMYPLRDYPPFINLLASFGHTPILGVMVGALFTAAIQSSSATAGIVIALTMQGMIDTPSAIAIVLGANIGTCITAALASIGTNIIAKRAVVAITIVKVFGVALVLVFFEPFIALIDYTGSNVTRQVANAHTIFNIFNVIIFYPILNPFLRLVEKIVPGKEPIIESGTKYLNQHLLKSTSVAIGAAKQELLRMAQLSKEMVQDSVNIFLNHEQDLIDQALQKEDLIDRLEKDIIIYLAEISQGSMSKEQSHLVTAMMHAANDFERIGDHGNSIVELSELKIEENLKISDSAKSELEKFYQKVDNLLQKSIIAFELDDVNLAQEVIQESHKISKLEQVIRNNHIERLNQKKCLPQTGVVYLDIINSLERVAGNATNISKVVVGEIMGETEYSSIA